MTKASVVPRDFLGIRMHISNVYLSGTLDWLKMHFQAWYKVFLDSYRLMVREFVWVLNWKSIQAFPVFGEDDVLFLSKCFGIRVSFMF